MIHTVDERSPIIFSEPEDDYAGEEQARARRGIEPFCEPASGQPERTQ